MSGQAGASLQLSGAMISDAAYELVVEGDIDGSTVDKFDAALNQVFAQKLFRVVVDLSKTNYVSSAGLGTVIAAIRTAGAGGGGLILTGASPKLFRVFELLGLPGFFRFAPNRQEALRMLKK